MKKTNCWEFRKCGREPGGLNVRRFGVCPASEEQAVDGIHGGKNGGRICWAVCGTLCRGEADGCLPAKMYNCLGCEFYEAVRKEEGEQFVSIERILQKVAMTG